MGYRESYKALNDILTRCEEGWTIQFNRSENKTVKVTAFKDEKNGLSFDVDPERTTIEKTAYMIRKLIEEVEAIDTTEETAGQNRTLPA